MPSRSRGRTQRTSSTSPPTTSQHVSTLPNRSPNEPRTGSGADGVNLLVCSGEAAKQTVFHFHIHVIPRFKDQPGKDAIGLPWDSVPSNPDEIERIGKLLS